MKQFLLFLVLIAGAAKEPLVAQGKHAYMDQPLPGETPQRFIPANLTAPGYFPLGRVAFSADGTEFFYGVNDAWFNSDHQKFQYFRLENGAWKGPVQLGEHYSEPTFSPDGKALFVIGQGVQQMRRVDSGWSQPIPYLKRSYTLYNFMLTRSGKMYVGSNGTWGARNDYSGWKFAVMPADIGDTSITSLGEPLNAPGFNGDFYIAPDESYIIISDKETKTFECELWISFRKPDETWTNPRSLGPAINEGAAHRFGQYVTPDGKFLFYTQGTSEKDCGLWWVRFDHLLKRLRRAAGE